MTPKEALERAIVELKTQTALAEAIGGNVKTGHIFYWLNAGKVPAEHAVSIERATNGEVKCEDLCPEVDWSFIRNEPVRA